MRKFITFVIISGCAFLFLGCDNLNFLLPQPKKPAVSKPAVGQIVVAKVGSLYITADDLNREVDTYNELVTQQGVAQNKIDSRDKKINHLKNEVVRKYILYQEALDRGIDKNEEIAKILDTTKMNLLVARLVRDEMQKIEVSDKEIEDFYNQNKEALREPEQRKISEILTNSEDEARQANIELLKGADFATVARQYSKAASASKGGDLGFVPLEFQPDKRIKFDKFYEVAFSPSLERGDLSNIFKGPDGYYIVKVVDIKQAQAKPLSELSDNIKNWLLFQKQEKAIADLASKLLGETKIEIYEGKVE